MADPYCLITGASSGIGRGIAERLSHGRNVLLHGRDAARLAESGSACGATARPPVTWTQDLGDIDGVASSLTALLGREQAVIETFIHSAGVVTVLPMRAVEHATVRSAMNVNVFSAMEIIRVLLSKKINQGALKNIVFISGIYSIRGAKGHSIYAASKGALDAYMLSLAAELAPAIRVNSVLPGAIHTRMSAAAFRDPAFVARMKDEYLLGVGEPIDVANAVNFLISDEARWITGQQIVVDGGRTVR